MLYVLPINFIKLTFTTFYRIKEKILNWRNKKDKTIDFELMDEDISWPKELKKAIEENGELDHISNALQKIKDIDITFLDIPPKN